MIYQVELPAPVLANQRPLRLVQCSDMHLFANPDSQLLGLNTQHSFEQVVALVKQQQSFIDLLLTTGDIAQQSEPATYQRFLQTMQSLDATHFCIPGNHDLSHAYDHHLPLNQLPCEVVVGSWCCILLDSSVDHEIAGSFSQRMLDYLHQALQRQHDKHILIALHHNPIAVGCVWLDQHMLKTHEAFFKVVAQHPQVKLVIHGHVHQEFEQQLHGVTYLSCPSTSLQFKPQSVKFTLDRVSPGYRQLDLYADGRFETQVNRLQDYQFSVDFQSSGY